MVSFLDLIKSKIKEESEDKKYYNPFDEFDLYELKGLRDYVFFHRNNSNHIRFERVEVFLPFAIDCQTKLQLIDEAIEHRRVEERIFITSSKLYDAIYNPKTFGIDWDSYEFRKTLMDEYLEARMRVMTWW